MNYKSTKRLSSFEEVSKEINALYNAINSTQQSVGQNNVGKEGNIRVVEGEDGHIYLEFKGRYGWYTSCKDIFQFKGKVRPEFEPTVIAGSSLIYVVRDVVTSSAVPSTVLLGTVPATYTLTKIFGRITSAFTDDNRISISDGSTIVASNIIDLSMAGGVFEVPFNKYYSSNTAINYTLTGTSSTGSMNIYLEAIKDV